eukprot:TRINITY_DN3617_c0_g1_i1.p1 TRINITY_DN3617_c0_g1~~TRINITY_DN3617_c0_g1_i1.p1  ORF type:complete len:181 (+),score=35.01 TRINITY_DN3617_c0_g1_i1:36-545(+)
MSAETQLQPTRFSPNNQVQSQCCNFIVSLSIGIASLVIGYQDKLPCNDETINVYLKAYGYFVIICSLITLILAYAASKSPSFNNVYIVWSFLAFPSVTGFFVWGLVLRYNTIGVMCEAHDNSVWSMFIAVIVFSGLATSFLFCVVLCLMCAVCGIAAMGGAESAQSDVK